MITEEQFIALYVRHEPELRSFARSLMPQSADAADLLQEACLAMWRKLGTLESERAFRSWAYSYVRLTALNHQRKRQASPLRFTDELIEIMSDEWQQEGDLAHAERAALARCLEELPRPQRQILALYYATDDNTAEKISERLKRPVAGIAKALTRARATLRTCVDLKLQPGGLS